MRQTLQLVMASMVATAAAVDQVSAEEWGWSAVSYPAGQVRTVRPTYNYARPTVTVHPHTVIQPNYIVRSSPGIWPVLSNGHLANQGQFDTDDATIPVQLYDRGYVHGVRSRFYPYYGYGSYWLPASPRL